MHFAFPVSPEHPQDGRIDALALNATMFIVGVVAGLVGQTSSLIADALDMLADASAYAIALGAIGRSTRFKAGAATLSGSLLR